MLLSEELKKLSTESHPVCVQAKYTAIVEELKHAAALGHTSCVVRFSETESSLVGDVCIKLSEQGLTVEEKMSSCLVRIRVTWG